LNSTDNSFRNQGSGLMLWVYGDVSMRFCTFARDGPANCLVFGQTIGSNTIRCLTVLNASCAGEGRFPGCWRLRRR
jgi:hypothetical protein